MSRAVSQVNPTTGEISKVVVAPSKHITGEKQSTF